MYTCLHFYLLTYSHVEFLNLCCCLAAWFVLLDRLSCCEGMDESCPLSYPHRHYLDAIAGNGFGCLIPKGPSRWDGIKHDTGVDSRQLYQVNGAANSTKVGGCKSAL